MKKSNINFVIDALMFLCMMAMAGIGFFIKYNLLPGQQRWVKYGRNVELYFWGLDRHQWGTIHLIIGLILLGLLSLHIILHWKLIVCIYRRLLSSSSQRIKVSLIFLTFSVALVILPFILKPNIRELAKGDGHFPSRRYANLGILEELIEQNGTSAGLKENHQHTKRSFDVRGYMTLLEISENYKVPLEYLKKNLGIPKHAYEGERLGLFRKRYDFKMSDVEKIIAEYYQSRGR